MNRKQFLTGISTLTLVGIDKTRTFLPTQRWGLVTAETHLGMVRTVWFNGCDVTSYCNAAHDGEGWVDVYPIDGKGYIVGFALRRLYGDVVIEMRR